MIDKYNLTIIIPHYNTPDLLEKLICSIPDLEDVQVIVIDDNSTKEIGKYELVKKKYGFRVEFYRNDTGIQSAGSCRNIGLEHAEGQWVLFADADDYFLPDMYNIVRKYFESDYDIVFFTPISVFIDTGEVANRHKENAERILKYLKEPNEENTIALRCLQRPVSKIIRRELVESNHIRFSQTLIANDKFFSVVCGFYAGKICACKETIYCITRNSGSLTMNKSKEGYDIEVNECIKTYRFLVDHYGRKMCKKLNITAAARLYEAIRRYGIKKCVEVFVKFKRNNIPIFSMKTFQLQHLYHMIKSKIEDKKYWMG